ncbi:MAG: hypothetical protein LOD92_04640, partial [Bacillales bacterium]
AKLIESFFHNVPPLIACLSLSGCLYIFTLPFADIDGNPVMRKFIRLSFRDICTGSTDVQ